jgi:hypothetical protein
MGSVLLLVAIVGLIIGYPGKRHSRENDPQAFRTNVSAGFAAAGCGGLLVLWAIVMILMGIGDRGIKPL